MFLGGGAEGDRTPRLAISPETRRYGQQLGKGRKIIARDDLRAQFIASKPAEIKQKCIETLRQVSALVDAKAPNDAVAFKGWLRHVSQRMAEAANEGGFLGIGGIQISEAEKATLAEISSALKLAT